MSTAYMWGRWNGYSNDHTLYASNGASTSRETTWDDGHLETIPEVDSIKSRRSSWSTLPLDQPIRAMVPPAQRNQHKEPAWSQPSPTIPDEYWGPNEDDKHASFSDISPISTPRESWVEPPTEQSVISPIEPLRSVGTQSTLSVPKYYPSLIPRKVSPEVLPLVESSNMKKEQTKWDPYSGEPNASGVPASSRPGIVPLEQQYPQLKERTRQILAGLREREQSNRPIRGKAAPPNAADPLDDPVQKEPWKGASGRAALVAPVKNTAVARVPAPTHTHRDLSHQDHEIPLATKNISSAYYQCVTEDRDTTPAVDAKSQNAISTRAEAPALTIRTVASDESINSVNSIKPVAPLKIRSRDPTPTHIQHPEIEPCVSPPRSTEPRMLQSPFRSPHPAKMFEEPVPLSSTQTESPHCDPSPVTPRTPTPEKVQAAKPHPTQQIDHEISRFSWTTYSTSVAESPGSVAHIMRNHSPPPPLPQLVIRKRPVSPKFNDTLYADADDARSQGSIVIRKPVPRKAKASTPTQLKHMSLSKTLPSLPSESTPGDKIANFESQLEALRRRKHNVKHITKDLSENLKRNQVRYDARKRKEVEGTIQNYENELQAILNEEHDVSLKMHRAVRKRDRDDNYEQPTGLWIRRVTS